VKGKIKGTFELTVESHFSAAHKLRDYNGACSRLHGHNFNVQVTIHGEELNNQGMLYDFREIKKYLKDTLDELDHNFLNELSPFIKENPTSENTAKWIFKQIDSLIGKEKPRINVKSVTVFESPRAYVKYSE